MVVESSILFQDLSAENRISKEGYDRISAIATSHISIEGRVVRNKSIGAFLFDSCPYELYPL